jgi:DNA-binding transcriptional MerR regulator
MPYKPAEVAKLIGISVQAVRDWSRQYAAILSPQARGEQGPRQFDDSDLDTMRTIAGLRRTGLRADDIIQRVQDGSIPPLVEVAQEAPQQSPQEPHTNVTAPPGEALALQIAHTTLTALQSRLDALEQRLDNQAREGRTRAGMFALGLVAGIFVVLIIAIVVTGLLGS